MCKGLQLQGPRGTGSQASAEWWQALPQSTSGNSRGSHASGGRIGTGPGKGSRTWSLGHASPVPLAHGPRPAGCCGQEATIVSLPESRTVQALFWAWRKRKRKQRKELLSWVGVGVETPSLPPERTPRPTSWEGSHVGPKDPGTSKKLAGC